MRCSKSYINYKYNQIILYKYTILRCSARDFILIINIVK